MKKLFSLCYIADRGEVFGWGNSEYGQMSSVTDEQQINTPRKLHLSGIGRVIDVACGGTVCMILNGGSEVRTDHPSTLHNRF